MSKYGMSALYIVRSESYGPKYYSGNWGAAVTAAYPDLRAYMANGTAWKSFYVRSDDTNLTKVFEAELNQFYACYGSYSAFQGFGQFAGSGSDRGHYLGEDYSYNLPYDLGNASVYNFATNSTATPIYKEGGAFSWAYNCNSDPSSTNDTVDSHTGYLYRSCAELADATKGLAYTTSGELMNETGIIQLLNDFHGGAYSGRGPVSGYNAAPLSTLTTSKNSYDAWWQANMYAALDQAIAYVNALHGTHWVFWQSFDAQFVTNQTHYMFTATTQGPYPTNLQQVLEAPISLQMASQGQATVLPYISTGSSVLSMRSAEWAIPYSESGNTLYQTDSYSTTAGSSYYNLTTAFGTVLNRMLDVGGAYGTSTKANIVVLPGVPGEGASSPWLSNFFNVTGYFPSSLTYPKYKAVVIWPAQTSNEPALTLTQSAQIKAFVKSGGGLVLGGTMYYPNDCSTTCSNYGLSQLAYLFGANESGTTLTAPYASYSVVSPSNSLLSPYGSSVIDNGFSVQTNYGFQSNQQWVKFSNESSTFTDIINATDSAGRSNLVMFSNEYFSGRAVVIPVPFQSCMGWNIEAGSFSDCPGWPGFEGDAQFTLMVNAIAWAAGYGNSLPIVSFPTSAGWSEVQPGWGTGGSIDNHVGFTIYGSHGQPPLVWFYSNNTLPTSVSLSLDTNYLGVNSNCMAISALTWSVVGTCSGGSLAFSNINVPPQSWNPVYVVNGTATNLAPLYTNVYLASDTLSATSASYNLDGPGLFSSWLVLNSASPPSAVSSSTSGTMPAYTSLSALNSSIVGMHWTGSVWQNLTQSGWYYDGADNLLYIHFIMGGPTRITVQEGPAATTTTISQSTSASTSSAVTSTTTTTSQATSTSTASTGVSTSASSSPGFSLNVSPSSDSVTAGSTATSSVSVSSQSSDPQTIQLSASGLPPSSSATFSPSAGLPDFSSTMDVLTTEATPPGTYLITVSGTSEGIKASATYMLTVDPPQQSEYTLTVLASNGGTTTPPPGAYSYAPNTNLTLRATPSTGWYLSSWLVNGRYAGNESSVALTLTSGTVVQAVFTQGAAPTKVAAISVDSSTPGVSIIIDGKSYSLPVSLNLAKGSTYAVSAPAVIQTGDTTRLLFTGWSGSVSSSALSLTINASRNLTIALSYETQYLVKLNFEDANSNPLTPSRAFVQCGAAEGSLPANMSMWLNAGMTCTVTQAEWMNENVIRANEFTVSHPGEYTIPLQVFSDTVKVVDIYGLPVSGATVKLVPWSGARLEETTGANGTVTFAQVPLGTYSGTVTYMGLTAGISSANVGNNASTVTVVLSYPILLSAGVLSLLVAVLAFRKRRRWAEANSFEGPGEGAVRL
jgi:hypothetical protein